MPRLLVVFTWQLEILLTALDLLLKECLILLTSPMGHRICLLKQISFMLLASPMGHKPDGQNHCWHSKQSC